MSDHPWRLPISIHIRFLNVIEIPKPIVIDMDMDMDRIWIGNGTNHIHIHIVLFGSSDLTDLTIEPRMV